MKFYRCQHCGNTIVYALNSGVPVVCCGEEMQELALGLADASREKHVPVIHTYGSQMTVKVGAVAHPMEEKHYITFIVLENRTGFQLAQLKPGGLPEAVFALSPADQAVAAWAYCNLHSLWKAEV
jgi:superoxide reductase